MRLSLFIHLALSSGSWVLGDRGKTCEQACAKTDTTCNAEKQSSLTTNELLGAAMMQAGYTCKSFASKSSSKDGAPLSTNRRSGDCTPITPGTVSSCTKNEVRRYKPLCYCEKGKVCNYNYYI